MDKFSNSVEISELPVWVIDDDDVRFSIRFALATHNLTVETFASGRAFLSTIRLDQPGCLLLNMDMRTSEGSDVLRALTEAGSPIQVIGLSGHATVRSAVTAMERGVSGFFEKPVDPEELVQKVTRCLAASKLAFAKYRIREVLQTFSRREAQIFELTCQGLTSAEMAEKLFLSQRTVEVHRAHIGKRLGNTPPIAVLYTLLKSSPDDPPLAGKNVKRE